jgi:dimethylamine/trimethylamine dehydrogenase
VSHKKFSHHEISLRRNDRIATVRDSRYDILLEPVQIGPVRAKNRFFQVPHCTGMGYRDPSAEAALRQVKAEGGWAVVCTEQVEIHPTSDITPFIELRLWDDRDLPALTLIADKIHEGGALAGIELAHNGMNSPNLLSRETPLGPAHLPVATWSHDPVQARAMTKSDIADLRRWHGDAVRRALVMGYDLVYVYAGHGLSGLQYFLSSRYNDRTDEYGGSVANRARLLTEILADTREIAAGRAAVGCRITVGDAAGDSGITRAETEEIVGMLAELPDLWDFVLGSWEDDSVTSRFGPEAGQEQHVRGLKQLTTKPVVGVGRFTSPDTMVRQITSGILDLIGAARPSIADPFLPRKIAEGRLEDIRECIGCNICVSGDFTMSPIRCTQNPAMGEEYRRGWHPERIRPRESAARIMVVGAGPAGLETARALGQRGYDVALADSARELGGRVARESRLPGLHAWRRVVEYREQQLRRMPNVEIYLQSTIDASDTAGFDHVVLATGAHWRRDGVGRWHTQPIPSSGSPQLLTPDDVMSGQRPRGERVIVFDDDHYYLGGVLAEMLAADGYQVRLVTPSAQVSAWTANTLELVRIRQQVMRAGIIVDTSRTLLRLTGDGVVTGCVFTGAEEHQAADAVLLVTARLPEEGLFREICSVGAAGQHDSAATLTVIGDAWAPGTIAAAVWSGRRYAEELDAPAPGGPVSFRREVTALDPA